MKKVLQTVLVDDDVFDELCSYPDHRVKFVGESVDINENVDDKELKDMADRNCQACDNYKDEYCSELDMKPCYPKNGCDYFSRQNKLNKAGLMDMPKEMIKVLDKIRAEIKDIAFDWQEIDGEHENFMVVNLNDALQIIDKYKEAERDGHSGVSRMG